MHQAEIILGLLVAVAALVWVANRLHIPYPILLVVGGLALSFVPHLPTVTLKPDHVFLLFLPPILYYAGLQTSWRDFRANIRPIGLLAIGLVLFTMLAVAIAAHTIIGMNWATSFVLGAIISPPDAVAATTILQRLRVPRRVVTILEGESLVNDATALVVYRFAVIAVVSGTFSLPWASVQFVIVSVGGVIIGLLAGIAVAWIRPRLRDSSVEHVVSLLTPFVAYLPAEWLHVSGVLAVVTCGIYIARRLGRITTAEIRLRAWAVWDTVIFLLNGLVFILIGLQMSNIIKQVPAGTLSQVIGWPIVIAIVAILARFAWVPTAAYVPRALFPRLRKLEPVTPPPQNVFIIAWTQMRGVVSLAAALALPMYCADGTTPFPDRNLIIFLTFGVILVTLVGQGLTLPAIIRALKLDRAGNEQADEENTARYLAALAAIERLDTLGANDAAAAAALQRARAEYDERIAYFSRLISPEGNGGILPTCENGQDVMREAIQAQRDMLSRLRDQGVIGDDVLRHLEHELDHEEARLLEEDPQAT
ncbi:MAG: monovalent cation/hydrogen antiporter [Phycisphaerales bacterium]|nr:monovalent cation/hydrogen antiporter [Phycisphaerales bacterium]